MNDQPRQPHAVLDLPSRKLKAMKIERLLDLDSRPGPQRVLEIGVGSGGISHYFGTHPSGRFNVVGVDVVDSRLVDDGYHFIAITNTSLPFPDASFDVVISNHVIEHVGDDDAQAHHLSELRRVMRDDGIGYLAVPNRWMLVEPHYRLAFLSWLPKRLRDPYLRISGRGHRYDCEPLRLPELESLLETSGLLGRNLCISALRHTLEIERPTSLATRLAKWIPESLLHSLRGVIPTLIYRLEKNRDAGGAENRQ